MSGTPNTTHDPVSRLIFELAKLPGIGEKTAARLAHHILRQDSSYARALSEALVHAKERTAYCSECLTFTDQPICRICSAHDRDPSSICVVEKPSDVFSIESSGRFRGRYHVLHGVISPLDGVGPDDIKIKELIRRVSGRGTDGAIREVIVATNPSVEGEATALYLGKLIKTLGAAEGVVIRVTQLAHGMPVGGVLEFTDRQTIGRALENRLELGGGLPA